MTTGENHAQDFVLSGSTNWLLEEGMPQHVHWLCNTSTQFVLASDSRQKVCGMPVYLVGNDIILFHVRFSLPLTFPSCSVFVIGEISCVEFSHVTLTMIHLQQVDLLLIHCRWLTLSSTCIPRCALFTEMWSRQTFCWIEPVTSSCVTTVFQDISSTR